MPNIPQPIGNAGEVHPDLRCQGGKFLTFRLASDEYGIEILKVREIIGMIPITEIPRLTRDIRGIINLRSTVIPVVDIRTRFGMDHVDDTDETCIIVLSVRIDDRPVLMGMLVDSVSEVLDIGQSQIEPAPHFGSQVDTRFIMGIAKIENAIKILLDAEEIFTDGDIRACAVIESCGDETADGDCVTQMEDSAPIATSATSNS